MSTLARIISLCALCVVVLTSTAHAEVFVHPSKVSFVLPDIGKKWEQEAHGDLIVLGDETDTLPDLETYVFPARTAGTLAEIEGRLVTELTRPHVTIFGQPVKTIKIESSRTETISRTEVRLGTAKVNGDAGVFAIVQRDSVTLILVGMPKPGAIDHGAKLFDKLVRGLLPPRGSTAARTGGTPQPPAPPGELPALPAIVAIRDVTASSTFTDRKRSDQYAPWRTLVFTAAADAALDVPQTAWCEGKSDEGTGESLTITLGAPTQIDTLRIAAGVWKSKKLFTSNNRIAALAVSLDGGAPSTVKPSADRTWLEVPVRKPVTTIRIQLAQITKGTMNDSCISGIELVRAGEPLIPLRGVDDAAATSLPRALSAIQTALAAPDRAGLDKLLEFPFSYRYSGGFFAGAPPAVKHATWKSVDSACRAQAEVDERKPVRCPLPLSVDAAERRTATIGNPQPGTVTVTFPSHREVRDVWRLRWSKGSWRLSAIDYE